jgi:hypothetical protein
MDLTKKMDAGKTEFVGSLFFKDGTLDIQKYKDARDQSSKERDEIRTGGYLVEIPQELSAEDCKKPYIREFYKRHPLASNIIIRPRESHEQPLARQNPNQKDGQTIQLVQKLKSAIYGERRPPPPTQEKEEPEPKRQRIAHFDNSVVEENNPSPSTSETIPPNIEE